jgi:PAS domain-containing protein
MSPHVQRDLIVELGGRIAELERQLAASGRAEDVQEIVETSLRATLAYEESIVDTVREPMLVLDDTLRVRTASRAFYETFRYRATKPKADSFTI